MCTCICVINIIIEYSYSVAFQLFCDHSVLFCFFFPPKEQLKALHTKIIILNGCFYFFNTFVALFLNCFAVVVLGGWW